MQHKWFFFTPAADGFDIIVRDTGAVNGEVLAEGSLRGKDFDKFVDEVLLDSLGPRLPEITPKATSEDWVGEPDEVETREPQAEAAKEEPAVPDVVDEVQKKKWF